MIYIEKYIWEYIGRWLDTLSVPCGSFSEAFTYVPWGLTHIFLFIPLHFMLLVHIVNGVL